MNENMNERETAFELAVADMQERLSGSHPYPAPLLRQTAVPHRLARFVLDWVGIELRIELRDTTGSPDHYIFWAATARGPGHLVVDRLIDVMVGPGSPAAGLDRALNRMRLELGNRDYVSRAVDRRFGPFSKYVG